MLRLAGDFHPPVELSRPLANDVDKVYSASRGGLIPVRHLLAELLEPSQDGGDVSALQDTRQMAFCKTIDADVCREQLAQRQQIGSFKSAGFCLVALYFSAPTWPVKRDDDLLLVERLDKVCDAATVGKVRELAFWPAPLAKLKVPILKEGQEFKDSVDLLRPYFGCSVLAHLLSL